MNENHWTTEDRPDPWEQSFYQTGSTKPKKRHRGLLAVVLVLVIFLGGIVSALGLLKVSFPSVTEGDNQDATFCFSPEATAPNTDTATMMPSLPTDSETPRVQLNDTPQSVENIPQEGGLSLQEIYQKAIGSVVSISCATGSNSASGTGVVLSADGYIVTNAHVVENAAAINVLFSDGSSHSAHIVGADTLSDLAVLYTGASGLTPAEFGNSTALRVGDSVVAIGDPLGVELRGTMTDGIVSAINRDVSSGGRTMTLIQTNAALNSGNSGGPLLNCYGQVIGINTMKIGDYMSSAGVEGLGFAIPSTTVKEIVDQLIVNGYVAGRPALGITGQDISSFDQLYYHLPQGIYITEVAESSDAAAKGILPGDILVQLDGQRVTNTDTLKSLLYAHKTGDTVNVVIYRGGTQYTLDIILGQSQ